VRIIVSPLARLVFVAGVSHRETHASSSQCSQREHRCMYLRYMLMMPDKHWIRTRSNSTVSRIRELKTRSCWCLLWLYHLPLIGGCFGSPLPCILQWPHHNVMRWGETSPYLPIYSPTKHASSMGVYQVCIEDTHTRLTESPRYTHSCPWCL